MVRISREWQAMRSFSLVAVAVFLVACAAELPEDALPIVVDGETYGYRHVESEPDLSRAVVTPGNVLDVPTFAAVRISGAPDGRTAGRVMGTVCGIDPDLAESYGDFGDPVGRDDATGEYIYWLDCRSGTIAE